MIGNVSSVFSEMWLSLQEEEAKESPLSKTAGKVSLVFFILIASISFLGMGPKKKMQRTPILTAAPLGTALPPPPPPVADESPLPPPPPMATPPPPQIPLKTPYAALRCTAEDQRKIKQIASWIVQYASGEMSAWDFGKNALTMIKYEPEIEPVHPFKFLSTIFLDPDLKKGMPLAFKFLSLRTGFMRGVNKGMNREAPLNNLVCYIPDFAREMQVPEAALAPLIERREWEKVVRLVMEQAPASDARGG